MTELFLCFKHFNSPAKPGLAHPRRLQSRSSIYFQWGCSDQPCQKQLYCRVPKRVSSSMSAPFWSRLYSETYASLVAESEFIRCFLVYAHFGSLWFISDPHFRHFNQPQPARGTLRPPTPEQGPWHMLGRHQGSSSIAGAHQTQLPALQRRKKHELLPQLQKRGALEPYTYTYVYIYIYTYIYIYCICVSWLIIIVEFIVSMYISTNSFMLDSSQALGGIWGSVFNTQKV